MDSTKQESAEHVAAEIEVLKLIRKACDSIRTGPRVDLSLIAIREIQRCDARLKVLERNLKRYGRRKLQPA